MSLTRMLNAISHLKPLEHPFFEELVQGTLPKNIFKEFLQQDALYLRDSAKALKQVSCRFDNIQYKTVFEKYSGEVIEFEKTLHQYLPETDSIRLFKVPTEKSVVISDYTKHLYSSVNDPSVEVAVASFIPCLWIYRELGKKISYTSNHPYYLWLGACSDPQFTSTVQSMIQILEELWKQISLDKQEKMISAFVISAKYEIAFLNSVYEEERLEDDLRMIGQSMKC